MWNMENGKKERKLLSRESPRKAAKASMQSFLGGGGKEKKGRNALGGEGRGSIKGAKRFPPMEKKPRSKFEAILH